MDLTISLERIKSCKSTLDKEVEILYKVYILDEDIKHLRKNRKKHVIRGKWNKFSYVIEPFELTHDLNDVKVNYIINVKFKRAYDILKIDVYFDDPESLAKEYNIKLEDAKGFIEHIKNLFNEIIANDLENEKSRLEKIKQIAREKAEKDRIKLERGIYKNTSVMV